MKRCLSYRCLLWVLACLLVRGGVAQPLPEGLDPEFPVTALHPLALLSGAERAVIRLDHHAFEVHGPGKATARVHRVVTVLGPEGRGYGEQVVYYDRLHKLRRLEGQLRDARGKVLRKLRNSDEEDYSAISGYSLYEDNRVRVARLLHDQYPYTVEFLYELEYDGLLNLPFWAPQDDAAPVEFARFDVRFPVDLDLRYALDGLEQEPVTGVEGSTRYWRWDLKVLMPFEPEPMGPSWEEQQPVVYIAPTRFEIEGYSGDMSTWASFGQWYNQLTRGRDILPVAAETELRQQVADAPTVREKVRRVYRYLQERTRYVSVQLGLGGWQPYDALYVHEKSYGDCKALVNYTFAMLKAVSITAYPALIYNGPRARDLDVGFPCNRFNHVILYVPLPDEPEPLWLECTSQTIPFGHIGMGNEDRYALVVKPEGGELARTPRSRSEDNRQVRTATVTLLSTGDASAHVETRYTGNQQDRVRQDLVLASPREREQWLHEELSIPSFEVIHADFTGVEAYRDTIDLPLHLKLPRYAARTGTRLFLMPNLMERWTFVPPAVENRTQPVRYDYAFVDTDTIRYVLPPGLRIEALPAPVDLTTPFGRYQASSTLEADGMLRYQRTLEIRETRIPASEYEAVRAFFRTVAAADRAQVVLVNP
jgi:hypothetical protein